MTIIVHKCEDCGATTVVNKNQKLIDSQQDKQKTLIGGIRETVEWIDTEIDPKNCKGCGKRLSI